MNTSMSTKGQIRLPVFHFRTWIGGAIVNDIPPKYKHRWLQIVVFRKSFMWKLYSWINTEWILTQSGKKE